MSAHIYYFPGAGRAEAIKLSLDLAGIPYTFKGVENWPEEKAEGLKTTAHGADPGYSQPH